MLPGRTKFERDLLNVRVKSALVVAKARDKKLGRHPASGPNQTSSPRRCSTPSTTGGAIAGSPATSQSPSDRKRRGGRHGAVEKLKGSAQTQFRWTSRMDTSRRAWEAQGGNEVLRHQREKVETVVHGSTTAEC